MKTLLKSSLVLIAFLFGLNVHAASVTQVRGKKALLDLSGMSAPKVGDQVFSVGADGKAKALMVIRQVKGTKAVADITKGSAQVGQGLKARGGAISRPVNQSDIGSPSGAVADRLSRQRASKVGPAWGVLGHLHMPSMDVDYTTTDDEKGNAKLGGMSFGVSGFYDYVLTPRFQIRGLGGLDQVNASKDNFDFKVMYLTLQGTARYILNEGATKWWVGGGGSFLLALSKSSNLLETDNISTNQLYSISFGSDISLSKDTFLPISFDYGIFPPSNTVKASMMTLRAGYAWYF